MTQKENKLDTCLTEIQNAIDELDHIAYDILITRDKKTNDKEYVPLLGIYQDLEKAKEKIKDYEF